MAEQSSLDQALARIMQPLSAAGGQGEAATTAPAATSATPVTSVTLGGTPPDTPVSVATDPAIAAAQKQIDDNNKAIMALISQTATPATATPAATTTPAAPAYNLYSQTRYTAGQPQSLSVGTAEGQWTPVTQQNARTGEVRTALGRSVGELSALPQPTAKVTEALAQMQGYLSQPMGWRDFLAGKGISPQQARAMPYGSERQALRQERQATAGMPPPAL